MAERRAEESFGPCALADAAAPSAHRPRGRESILAAIIRYRACENGGGLRISRRVSVASRTARLARARICGQRMGCKRGVPHDGALGDLSAGLGEFVRPAGTRSGESFVRSRTARAIASGKHSRSRLGCEWITQT